MNVKTHTLSELRHRDTADRYIVRRADVVMSSHRTGCRHNIHTHALNPSKRGKTKDNERQKILKSKKQENKDRNGTKKTMKHAL